MAISRQTSSPGTARPVAGLRLRLRLGLGLALALGLILAGPAPARAMSLETYERLTASESGDAALRWYFTGLRDALRVFEAYERTSNRLAGRDDARVQSLYCIDDDTELTTGLLRDLVELRLERTADEGRDKMGVNNALLDELSRTFPCADHAPDSSQGSAVPEASGPGGANIPAAPAPRLTAPAR